MEDAVQDAVLGTVYLVGAGPGDPELLTLKGARLLEEAGAVVFDALTNPVLLDRAPAGAERFDVGKRAGRRSVSQEAVNRLLADLARRHDVVVRLKGGDPFVFGRGGEEALALRAAGVPFQVVPGVTSGVGALAYAGIPLTHRGVASAVTFVTGHHATTTYRAAPPDPKAGNPLARDDATVVVFMGLRRVAEVAEELVRHGRPLHTPAAVVHQGTLPDQRTVVGTLADIGERAKWAELEGPALIVVGNVVGLSERLAWAPASESPASRSPALPLVPAGAGA